MTTCLRQKASDPLRPRPPAANLSFVLLVAALLLVQGVAAVPIIVAASDGSPAAKARADYTCDGLDDQAEIQAALDALPPGGTVVLSEGTFNCSGSLVPAANATLLGQGPDKTSIEFSRNGLLNVSEETVTLDGFHVTGSHYVNTRTNTTLDLTRWHGVVTIYASHAKIHNITGTADTSIQAVFLLLHHPNV